MEIIIKGDAKEIAALVLAIQERQLERQAVDDVVNLLQKKQ